MAPSAANWNENSHESTAWCCPVIKEIYVEPFNHLSWMFCKSALSKCLSNVQLTILTFKNQNTLNSADSIYF